MSALKVKSILADIDDFLTEKAREIYNKPRVDQSVGEIDGVPYKVQYLAILTNSRVTGAVGIAQIINDCVENYNVLGVLVDPSQLQLKNVGMEKVRSQLLLILLLTCQVQKESSVSFIVRWKVRCLRLSMRNLQMQ